METRQFEPIVEMKNVGLAYGDNPPVLSNIDFSFRRGSIHFLTGKKIGRASCRERVSFGV